MKKIVACLLCLILSLNVIFVQSLNVSASEKNRADLYAQNTCEQVVIDGITYFYNMCYENGNRTILISNNTNDIVDKIVYSERESKIYVNDSSYVVISAEYIENESSLITANGEWITMSSDSHYISWAEGTTVAVLAGMISVYLSGLGPAGVIGAMGTTALGIIASTAIGGRVYVNMQCFQVPLVAPSYRLEWWFVASTGDSYGKYYYHL